MFSASISTKMHLTQRFAGPLTGYAATIINDTILTEAERA